jgi:hypothetical protein
MRLQMRVQLLAGLLAVIATGASPCVADTLVPTETEYSSEVTDGPEAKACNLVLVLDDLPAPETIAFRLTVTRWRSEGEFTDPASVGFRADVLDATFVYGAFAGLEERHLVDVSLSSPGFDTAEEFHLTYPDNGRIIGFTKDQTAAFSFLTVFSRGDFQISFVREDASDHHTYNHTYKVSSPIPTDIVESFNRCSHTLD